MNPLQKNFIDSFDLSKPAEPADKIKSLLDSKPAPKGRVYALPPPSDQPDAKGSFDFGSPVVGASRDGMRLITQDRRDWVGTYLEDGSLVYDPVSN